MFENRLFRAIILIKNTQNADANVRDKFSFTWPRCCDVCPLAFVRCKNADRIQASEIRWSSGRSHGNILDPRHPTGAAEMGARAHPKHKHRRVHVRASRLTCYSPNLLRPLHAVGVRIPTCLLIRSSLVPLTSTNNHVRDCSLARNTGVQQRHATSTLASNDAESVLATGNRSWRKQNIRRTGAA